ncbi:MAG TPA: C40 family peptidase [Candidatus Lachnoclostridium stercorigallinarum]|uniref:C40 family peptidase n=1 Tax=Candidatus Lachnoclostridium stercorigallinarum TaxID=2838634 RepID=A0A9D2GGB9_9FIRM|nr:C40 family peptidase [Candidatus Lachnoclostridium stercorigallinarum]
MNFKPLHIFGLVGFCGAIAAANPMETMNAMAAPQVLNGPGMEQTSMMTVISDSVFVKTALEGEEVLTEAIQGASFHVVDTTDNGWIEVAVGNEIGYLPVTEDIVISENEEEAMEVKEEVLAQAAEEQAKEDRRQNLVNYALQFVGGPYKYGGSDPHTGVDCSGFTRYVLQHGAGVSIARSSTAQSRQGREISAAEMRPGDLIFYGSGKSINHVGLYIGDGQIVHASTYETGIKTSPWNYRAPVKIVNVMGD